MHTQSFERHHLLVRDSSGQIKGIISFEDVLRVYKNQAEALVFASSSPFVEDNVGLST